MTNVSPMKLAMANAITMLVARNSAARSRRRASIGCGWWVSTYTSSGERERPRRRRGRRTHGSSTRPAALVERVGDRRQPEPGQHEAGDVEAPGRRLGVLAQEAQPEGQGGDAERHVDEEDPAPADGVGEEAAEHRTERRGDERRDHHDRRRPRPLDRREGAEQHRDADRRQHPAADALHDAERDELADRLGRTPHSIEPPTNSTSAVRKTRLVPKRSPIQPLAGIHTASDSV